MGLKGVTDGEFRRTYLSRRLPRAAGGRRDPLRRISSRASARPTARRLGSSRRPCMSGARSSGSAPIQGPDFDFLKSVATRTPKVCIPAPSMLHFRGGREAISEAVYPNLEDFYDDLTAAYRAEVADLAARGLALSAVRRHQPRLSLRSRDPRPHQGARRRSGHADPPLLPAGQQFDPRPAQPT